MFNYMVPSHETNTMRNRVYNVFTRIYKKKKKKFECFTLYLCQIHMQFYIQVRLLRLILHIKCKKIVKQTCTLNYSMPLRVKE